MCWWNCLPEIANYISYRKIYGKMYMHIKKNGYMAYYFWWLLCCMTGIWELKGINCLAQNYIVSFANTLNIMQFYGKLSLSASLNMLAVSMVL